MTTPFVLDYFRVAEDSSDRPANPNTELAPGDPGTSPEAITSRFEKDTKTLIIWDPDTETWISVRTSEDEVDALDVTYDNSGSGLTATNVKDALDELSLTVAGSIAVEDEGINLTSTVTKFNFVGSGVTVTEPIADEILVTIPGNPADTDAVPEGATNLYYTAARVQEAVGGFLRPQPQARLTLQSATPVMTADQTAKSTIFCASFVGDIVPVWNGTIWEFLAVTGNQISFGLDAGVPRVVSGSVYDVWGVKSGGNLALGIGPAWSTTVSRGSGAGTTEYELRNGIPVNKNTLTNVWGGAAGTTDLGPISANRATLLGSFYATANGQTGFSFMPAAASGGSNNILGLCNAFNRVPIVARERDNATSWTYNSTTWRPLNGASSNVNNRVTFIDCLQQSAVFAHLQLLMEASDGNFGNIGLNLDSTSADPVPSSQFGGAAVAASFSTVGAFPPQLGLHYIQAMECAAAGTLTFHVVGATPTRNYHAMLVSLDM